jgi:hypothetical protein
MGVELYSHGVSRRFRAVAGKASAVFIGVFAVIRLPHL